MEEPTRSLLLTGLETVFLCDSIRNDDLAQGLPDPDAKIPVARAALLLLASAYKEVVSPAGIVPGPVWLEVTEEQVWLFRSKTTTGSIAIDGKTNIGISLLLKLYDLIIRFKYGDDVDTEGGEEGLSLSPEDLKHKLEEFNAGANQNTDTNQDNGSNDGAGAPDGSRTVVPGSEGKDYTDYSPDVTGLSNEDYRKS